MNKKEYHKQYHIANREKILERAKAWYVANKDKKIKYDIEYNKKNRHKRNIQTLNWVINNYKRRVEIRKDSYHKNKGRVFANCAARRARLSNAMPKWLTKEQKLQIINIYINRPIGYHVDHIVPLKGKNVCGLHVPWNLQYLLAKENFAKGNKI